MEADELALDRFIQEYGEALLELFDELLPGTGVKQIHLFPSRPGEYLELTIGRRTLGNPEPNEL